MRFEFVVRKWANFYFFVQNLSEWHFSCRKDYNVLWRQELGEFSPKEENYLKNFRELRSKYKSSRTHFEQIPFTSDNPLKEFKKVLSLEEYEQIEKTFSLFERKFDSLYKKEFPVLEQWKKDLDKKANDLVLVNSIIDILSILFDVSESEMKIKIYLLFSNINHTGGGTNIDAQSVSLEISRYPLENIGHVLGIMWHEIIHLLFQNHYFYPLILDFCHNDQKTADFINEITISSLFPRGILGVKLLKNKPPLKLSPQISPDQTFELLNLTKKYIDCKKRLDKAYIESLSMILKRGGL